MREVPFQGEEQAVGEARAAAAEGALLKSALDACEAALTSAHEEIDASNQQLEAAQVIRLSLALSRSLALARARALSLSISLARCLSLSRSRSIALSLSRSRSIALFLSRSRSSQKNDLLFFFVTVEPRVG